MGKVFYYKNEGAEHVSVYNSARKKIGQVYKPEGISAQECARTYLEIDDESGDKFDLRKLTALYSDGVYIILTDVSSEKDRGWCESVENNVYTSDELLVIKRSSGVQGIISISDYMDAVNNDEVDTSDVFMTYVRVVN